MNAFKQPECIAPRRYDKWRIDKWNGRPWFYTIIRVEKCWCVNVAGRCKTLDKGMCNGLRAVIHYGWRDQVICVWTGTENAALSRCYTRTKKGDRFEEFKRDTELREAQGGYTEEG